MSPPIQIPPGQFADAMAQLFKDKKTATLHFLNENMADLRVIPQTADVDFNDPVHLNIQIGDECHVGDKVILQVTGSIGKYRAECIATADDLGDLDPQLAHDTPRFRLEDGTILKPGDYVLSPGRVYNNG